MCVKGIWGSCGGSGPYRIAETQNDVVYIQKYIAKKRHRFGAKHAQNDVVLDPCNPAKTWPLAVSLSPKLIDTIISV